MSKKSITQMNSIVVDGINNTTNDDLLVVARPSNVEIGTNFKLPLQTFIKFLRNDTIGENAFLPLNINNRFINIPENQTLTQGIINLKETESLTVNDYGLIIGKNNKTNIGRDFYEISGTINAVLEKNRSYFDSTNSYRSPTLGDGFTCFVRDSNGTENDNWSALFDKTYDGYVFSEITITQGQCDKSNESNQQLVTKLYVYWGTSINTVAGAFGQFSSRSKISKIKYTNFNFPDRAQLVSDKRIGYRDEKHSDYNANLYIISGDAKFLDLYTIEGTGDVEFKLDWNDDPYKAQKVFGSPSESGGLEINSQFFEQPALVKKGSITKTIKLNEVITTSWLTPLSRINVDENGIYDQQAVFAYDFNLPQVPLFEIDTQNRKIKKLPITPYNYDANLAQLGLTVTIESF